MRTYVLPARPGRPPRAVDVPESEAELDRLYAVGGLPLRLGLDLDVLEAVAVARALPPVTGSDRGTPAGYGVLPPRGSEPWVDLAKGVRDHYGNQVPRGATGILGCLWRARRRNDCAVFRLWFRSELEGHAGQRLRGPVDCYEDAIGSVRVAPQARHAPRLLGWEICRLDHGTDEAAGLVDARGNPTR